MKRTLRQNAGALGQALIAAGGGAGRRSAKTAARPLKQSREALLSPLGGIDQHQCALATGAKGTHPLRVGTDGGPPASSSRSAGAAHHLPLLDVGG
jgi:hypothetical protein